MVHIAFDPDESVLARFHKDPEQFTSELRIAAALVRAPPREPRPGRRDCRLSGAEFMDALGRYGVSPFQQTADIILLCSDGLTKHVGDH